MSHDQGSCISLEMQDRLPKWVFDGLIISLTLKNKPMQIHVDDIERIWSEGVVLNGSIATSLSYTLI